MYLNGSLMKCYGMLQNVMVTAFTVFELLKEKPTWGGGAGKITPDPPKLGLKGL